MSTSLNKYLDPAALDETVVNIKELIEGLEAEMQDLPYARPDGLYPDMTVGAVIGADDTAQWATRESTGSGAATVRSVQGAVEVQDGELVPVQIAGIRSTAAQGGELDSVEWPTQTLRAAGTIRDELTSDELVTRVGVVDLGTLAWSMSTSGDVTFFYAQVDGKRVGITAGQPNVLACAKYTPTQNTTSVTYLQNGQMTEGYGGASSYVYIVDTTYTDAASFKAAMIGVYLFYELATPTTQPISPALDMTYKVQQGGSEYIIVPDGEVSAVPVLTVAEPVNAGDEFARIWAAIESLGYTRNAAQLSRPISLTDVGSIDEVQKDTTDVVEIDTTKEVTE